MAVQAQHSSRKRGREHTPAMSNPFISLPSQSQLIDLTQLHTPPPPHVVSTGLRLAFGDHQQLQHSLSAQSSQYSVFFSGLAGELGHHINQQRDEIEHYLRRQGDQLRRTLEEKRKRHYCALLGAAGESVARLLREKEEEVEKARMCNAELEARAAQMTAEAQAWQATARAHELTAAALQAQLKDAMASGGGGRAGCTSHLPERNEGNGKGCAGGEEDAESAYIDPDRVEAANRTSCRECQKRVASVVLLPCRHLCLCTRCDVVCMACPLCLSLKNSSVEVFLC